MQTTQQPSQGVGLNTLVHLGAGSCGELEEYLTKQPQHILLVEADPEQAKALRIRTQGLSNVQVVTAVVTDQIKDATFYRYSLAEASSLRQATGLLDLFPGLRKIGEISVTTTPPGPLLSTLNLKAEQNNTLVIDTPGEEFCVLQALKEDGKLHLFNQIQINCGREALYEGSEPASVIVTWLKKEGYDIDEEDDSQDPDRPTWLVKRNDLHIQNLALSQDIASSKKQHEFMQEELARITHAYEEKCKQLSERQEQLGKLTQARDEQAKLATERQEQIEQLGQARDAQAKLATERQEQIEQLRQARDEQAKLATERQVQIEQLGQARDEQAKLVETHQQNHEHEKQRADNNQRQLEHQQEEHDRLKQQLNELNQRLPMLDDEFVKAEAQIELIKDILIREKAF